MVQCNLPLGKIAAIRAAGLFQSMMAIVMAVKKLAELITAIFGQHVLGFRH